MQETISSKVEQINIAPLAHVLETYYHVEYTTDDWEGVRRFLNHASGAPERATNFRRQLVEAIQRQSISPEEMERLTGLDCETREDVADSLRELWRNLYGNQPIEVDDAA